MPTVSKAARLTTRDTAVWRTCIGCGQLAPLPPEVDHCCYCDRSDVNDATDRHARFGWELAHRYAAVVGRIEAWAVLISHVSDAERLDHIRQALSGLADLHDSGRP
jgi:hypothetical protein